MSAAVIADQPEPPARLFFGRSSTESSSRHSRTASTSKGQWPKFGGLGRQRNQSDASSQKMLISAPTDFRHLTSGSRHAFPAMPLSMNPIETRRAPQAQEFLQFSHPSASEQDWESDYRRESAPPFEPLELSIYTRQSRLSPLLPQLELPFIGPSPPPAYAREESQRIAVLHSQRSMPLLFRVSSHSPDVSDGNSSPKSLTCTTTTSRQAARLRSHTSPDVEAIRDRVANAMQEVERLQKKIEDVMERQSMYTPSRPSSAHSSDSLARTLIPDLEPMPSIPALPPSAPSFAERLHGEADGLPTGTATSAYTTDEAGLIQGTRRYRRRPPPALEGKDKAKAMAPPLPLVLRPPLRKKKPFPEGLSGFVFPIPPRKISLDSVGNNPRPIKQTNELYQCVPVNGAHISYESLHSLSSSRDGGNSEAQSVHSSYLPTTPRELPVERCATFGQDAKGLSMSVGVAL
ncbi:hypothetical protein A9K55_005988 [Cordyceps militaris]|uniref:Uncharacterized protein n=1 Tax=Cordyceps militaris TaxID=73501 RepID=A0A2H4SAA3_CORMI|nr:hypothetical protein A9K55_005988 [Cordyceps militaris]